jgi:O-antigen/teichoic acid export membrane protein
MYQRHLLHGQLQIPSLNLSEILERVLYILLFILFVWYLGMGLVGVSIALSVSTLFLFLQLFRHSRRFKPTVKQTSVSPAGKPLLRKLWGYGQWSYYSGFIEYIILNFPILFLKSSVSSFAQIGFFSKAQGLANYPKGFAVPVSGLLFSYNAGSNPSGANNRTEVVCRFSFWIVTILFAVLAIFIRPVITLLYGEAFLPAASIFLFLYPSVVFYIQSLFLASDIAARGLNKETFTIRLKSLPVIVITAYFLITYFEITGAALAISLSFTILWVQYALKYFSLSGSGFGQILLLRKNDLKLLVELIKNIKRKVNKK